MREERKKREIGRAPPSPLRERGLGEGGAFYPRRSPSGSRPLAGPFGVPFGVPARGFARRPQWITVAILAQGAYWAVALAQAFCLPGFDPCRAQMIVAPRRGEGLLERGPDTTRREATKYRECRARFAP